MGAIFPIVAFAESMMQTRKLGLHQVNEQHARQRVFHLDHFLIIREHQNHHHSPRPMREKEDLRYHYQQYHQQSVYSALSHDNRSNRVRGADNETKCDRWIYGFRLSHDSSLSFSITAPPPGIITINTHSATIRVRGAYTGSVVGHVIGADIDSVYGAYICACIGLISYICPVQYQS